MKQQFLFQYILFIPILGFLLSCSDKNQFTVNGTVKDGNNKMIYFENVTTSKVVLLDSLKLNKNGAFQFKHKRPLAPDFYRLRLSNQLINFAVDTTETITIHADTIRFPFEYTVEGSLDSKNIKTLTLLQKKTNETFNQLQNQFSAQTITADEYQEKVNACVNEYKNEALQFIYSNPASTSAYFALFQQINGLLLFDPYDKTDSRAFGAVANNWNQHYPNAPRTKHLVQLFTTSLAVIRGERLQNLDAYTVEGKDFFDISLMSFDNSEQRLSEVGKDKVVLLDFTMYGMNESPQHNQNLARLYNRYYRQGFRIYQISLDTDVHFWKNAAANLPWTCVIDPNSVNSDIVRKYMIRQIPTGFLFNRQGDIVKRIENYAELADDILPFLK